MTNSQAWDRVADKYGDPAEAEVVQYGVDLPTEAELRLCGDMTNKRVLDLGCGRGENAVTFARQAAHVIAIDSAASAARRRPPPRRPPRGARRVARG